MRSAFVSVTLAGLVAGCTGRCEFNADCANDSYCDQEVGRCYTQCFANSDCEFPAGCEFSEQGCGAIGAVCVEGRCVGDPDGPGGGARPGEAEDGWDDPPLTGPVFVLDTLSLGEAGVGFSIEGSGGPAVDNRLSPIAGYANPPVDSGLAQGVTIVLVEIAGLLEGFDGDDYAVTLKFYGGEDADADPTNNFRTAPGAGPCCTFRAAATSFTGGPMRQAVTRARARIVDGALIGVEPFSLNLTLGLGTPRPEAVVIEHGRIRFRVDDGLDELERGVIGGALPMSSLAQIDNPYCRNGGPGCPPVSANGTLLDLVSALVGPADIDLDDDGLECVWDANGNQEFDLCCEGRDPSGQCQRNGVCTVETITSADPADPAQCVLRGDLADGYSVGIEFTGVRARLQ